MSAMVFGDKRQEVINVIKHEQEGRTGWLASDRNLTEAGFSSRVTQMFYPDDMYTLEP